MSTWSKAIAGIVLLALLFEGKVVYLTAYSLLALALGLRWAVRRASAQLSFRRTLSRERLFPGETAQVRLEVTNPSPFPLPWILLEESVDKELVCREGAGSAFATSIAGRSSQVIEYSIQAKKRGVYGVGPLLATLGDPIGFEQTQVRMDGRSEVVVYPRVYPLDALGISGGAVTGVVKSFRRYLEDPTRVAGIRDHAPGESIRYVHWKATAHTGSLKVKSFEPTRHVDVVVLLDLVRDHYRSWNVEAMSELAVEVAASLLAEGCQKRQEFGFFALARLGRQSPDFLISSGMRKGETHLAGILEMLAQIELCDQPALLGEALDRIAGRVAQSAVVFVVAPRIDPGTQHALVRFVKAGRRAVVVEVSEERERLTLPRGISHVRVSYRGDLVQTMARRNPGGAAQRESTA